ncbi:hypothetical protein AB1Y20_009740 [Prymnesium parvum]|uniref:Mannosyltransferase n=1 Tax=Prymnesium parvum TaxID=97485 RepID=A0AB34K2G6_PRYPA
MPILLLIYALLRALLPNGMPCSPIHPALGHYSTPAVLAYTPVLAILLHSHQRSPLAWCIDRAAASAVSFLSHHHSSLASL